MENKTPMVRSLLITVIKTDDGRFVVQAGDKTLAPEGLAGLIKVVTAILKQVFGISPKPTNGGKPEKPGNQRMDN